MFIGALFQLGLAVLVLNSSQQKIYVIAVSLAVIIASFFVTKKVYNISYLRTVIVGLVFVALAVVFAMIVLKIGLPVALFFSKH